MSDLAKEWAEIVKMADGLDIKDGQECDWSDFDGDLYDLATQEGVDELRGVQAGIIPIADAVLSSKARKQLPDSAFCGPNRSFPVHDAAHVRNALARLPQAKNFSSEQKARILSCVRGRAKKFGVKVTADQLEYPKLVELLDKKSDADLDAKGPEGETDNQKIRRLSDQLESAKGKIKDQDATITKLMDEQKNLQGELKKLYAKRIFNLRSELKKGDVAILDSEEKRQDFLAKLGLRTVSSLRDSIHDLEAELAPSAGSTADPRKGAQTPDPTRDMADADQGGKPPEGGKGGKTDDSEAKPEDRFASMLSGSK
jgi:septal ring factor EnvC (AmiA/AmiB activator)